MGAPSSTSASSIDGGMIIPFDTFWNRLKSEFRKGGAGRGTRSPGRMSSVWPNGAKGAGTCKASSPISGKAAIR
jgi:hypothetical protein